VDPSPLPARWATDLTVLEASGSHVERHDDHLVVRTPRNPGYHWGNFVLVTDPSASDDAARWLARHADVFAEADWVSIGLVGAPTPSAWDGHGVELEEDESLAMAGLPRLAPCPQGYAVRPLTTDADWGARIAVELADNEESGEYEASSHERFVRARTDIQREVVAAGGALFVGAFDGDGRLAADLGIVVGDGLARYQDVGTRPEHRRRGLAAHLLGVAAQWAATQGVTRFVIVTGVDNPAGRVYRGVGFEPDRPTWTVYRRPPLAG